MDPCPCGRLPQNCVGAGTPTPQHGVKSRGEGVSCILTPLILKTLSFADASDCSRPAPTKGPTRLIRKSLHCWRLRDTHRRHSDQVFSFQFRTNPKK